MFYDLIGVLVMCKLSYGWLVTYNLGGIRKGIFFEEEEEANSFKKDNGGFKSEAYGVDCDGKNDCCIDLSTRMEHDTPESALREAFSYIDPYDLMGQNIKLEIQKDLRPDDEQFKGMYGVSRETYARENAYYAESDAWLNEKRGK